MFPDLTFGSNGPLRGGKQSTFEGGVRMPAIFHWPGKIPPQQVSSGLLSVADIFPTVLDYLELPLPADRVYDGVSLCEHLAGAEQGATEFVERELYFGSGEITAAKFGKWMLVLPKQPKFLDCVLPSPMLFDLSEDMSESRDRAEEYPERVQNFVARIQAWEQH